MKRTQPPITPQSVDALWSKLERGPFPPYGQATICCLGCGKRVTVEVGHERTALVEMRDHALGHDRELSEEFRAAVKHGPATNRLIASVSWGMADKGLQN